MCWPSSSCCGCVICGCTYQTRVTGAYIDNFWFDVCRQGNGSWHFSCSGACHKMGYAPTPSPSTPSSPHVRKVCVNNLSPPSMPNSFARKVLTLHACLPTRGIVARRADRQSSAACGKRLGSKMPRIVANTFKRARV